MYENLFQPITLAGLTVPNRIARSAHGTGLPWPGTSDDLVDYHAARAREGVGLMFLEKGGVMKSTTALFPAYDRSILAGYDRLRAAIQPHGTKLFVQLLHRGSTAINDLGGPPWAPSTVPNPVAGMMTRPMTKGMIDEFVEGHAISAALAKEGGLDGVQIHAAHGYLLGEFLSPGGNHRTDEYGGSPENRARILIEVLDAVRAAVGPDFPISVRLSADDDIEGGMGPAEVAQLAAGIDGMVDLFDLSLGTYYRLHRTMSTCDDPPGYELPAAEVVARAVNAPTMVTGRILSLEHASRIVADGQADIVSLVRAMIADPFLITKSKEGRAHEVRPCIGCNVCVAPRMTCAVSFAAGRESTVPFEVDEPAATPRRVLVAGGGPGGLEAARTAALRGHTVELHEATGSLGGQMALTANAPHRSDYGSFVRYMTDELKRLGVSVRYDSRVTARDVASFGADVVIVATGSAPRRDGFQSIRPVAPVPGFDLPHVHSSWDLLGDPGRIEVGGRALVYDDPALHEGLAVVDALQEAGAEVTYVTPHDGLALRVTNPRVMIGAARERVMSRPLTILPNSSLREITPGEVVVTPRGTDRAIRVPADTVVMVDYNVGVRDLLDELEGAGVEVHAVGDANGGGSILQAVHDAARATRGL
ncbi:MAG TPA: FAD-dependent oxidoreductase [Acidimicrobiales bacterium]|nr:FAD-dependent oxidoreductase [Acidimicrobiales bacterium]